MHSWSRHCPDLYYRFWKKYMVPVCYLFLSQCQCLCLIQNWFYTFPSAASTSLILSVTGLQPYHPEHARYRLFSEAGSDLASTSMGNCLGIAGAIYGSCGSGGKDPLLIRRSVVRFLAPTAPTASACQRILGQDTDAQVLPNASIRVYLWLIGRAIRHRNMCVWMGERDL